MKYIRKETIIYAVLFAAAVFYYVITASVPAVVILAALAFYAAFAAVAAFAGGRNLKVTSGTKRMELRKNEKGSVCLQIKNESPFPVFRLDGVIRVKNLLTGAQVRCPVNTSVLPRGSGKLETVVKSNCCGMLNFAAGKFFVSDPLRIFSRAVSVPAEKSELLLVPELSETVIDPDLLWSYDMESFRFAQSRTGTDPSETVGIRDYVPGDNVRSIHWKLSAKTDTVVLREPGLPIDNRLMLIADKRIPEGGIKASKIDEITQWFLSLSRTLLERGMHHTIGWFDFRQMEYRTETLHEMEELYQIIPAFLSAPWSKDDYDAGERFTGAETEKNYAIYLIVAPSEGNCEKGVDKMREYGQVSVLIPEGKERNT